MPSKNPPMDVRHYCRWCDAQYEAQTTGAQTAHMRAQQHAYFAHRKQSEIQPACTRYCEMREQPEEKLAGAKRYGTGAEPLPKPLIRAEDLGPEDDHA